MPWRLLSVEGNPCSLSPWIPPAGLPSVETLSAPPVRRHTAQLSARAGRLRRDDPTRQLHAVVDAQLVEDARKVALNCAFGDEQAAGDLRVRGSAGDQRRYLSFASRQGIARHCI